MLYPWDKSAAVGVPSGMVSKNNLNLLGLGYDYTLRADLKAWCRENRARFIVVPSNSYRYPFNVWLHTAEKATLFKLWWC